MELLAIFAFLLFVLAAIAVAQTADRMKKLLKSAERQEEYLRQIAGLRKP